jgi:hypothetical protein
MIKRLTSILIAGFVLQFGLSKTVFCEIPNPIEARRTEMIKERISEIGAKPNNEIEVVLTDKKKLRGVITETSDNSFTIVNEKTAKSVTVQYSQVQKVKAQKLSGKAQVIIGIALIAGIVIAVALSLPD